MKCLIYVKVIQACKSNEICLKKCYIKNQNKPFCVIKMAHILGLCKVLRLFHVVAIVCISRNTNVLVLFVRYTPTSAEIC